VRDGQPFPSGGVIREISGHKRLIVPYLAYSFSVADYAGTVQGHSRGIRTPSSHTVSKYFHFKGNLGASRISSCFGRPSASMTANLVVFREIA